MIFHIDFGAPHLQLDESVSIKHLVIQLITLVRMSIASDESD